MKRASLSMAVLLPSLLLAIVALIFNTQSVNQKTLGVARLQPLKAAQLAALPEGGEVLLEGTIDRSSTTQFGSLVAYRRDEHLLDTDLSDLWLPNGRAASAFALDLPDGQVRIDNTNYEVANPPTQIEWGLMRYQGVALGDRVTVIGTVTHAAAGTKLIAQVVSGGTRLDLIAAQSQASLLTIVLGMICLTLLAAIIGLVVTLRRQKHDSHPALS